MATLLVDAPPSDPNRVGTGSVLAGRYRVTRLIGSGGFATVFAAQHAGTGQPVAVKVLCGPDLEDDIPLRRFFREARVTAGLNHPNTVRVFDFGQDDDGTVFLAMELLKGATLRHALRHRLRDGRVFEQREAIDIAVTITRSLGEAHAKGLVHRDLKPDNVFLHQVAGDDPMIKVLDFGIVKSMDGTLTANSSTLGTPWYMSPEQVLSHDLDGRSDLYSLGVMLYQLVSGRVPFRGATSIATAMMHVHDPPEPLEKRARTPVSQSFCQLVHRAMAKTPDERFPDARAMREALLALERGPVLVAEVVAEVVARPTAEPARPPDPEALLLHEDEATSLLENLTTPLHPITEAVRPRRSGGGPWKAIALTLGAAALAAAIVFLVWPPGGPRGDAPQPGPAAQPATVVTQPSSSAPAAVVASPVAPNPARRAPAPESDRAPAAAESAPAAPTIVELQQASLPRRDASQPADQARRGLETITAAIAPGAVVTPARVRRPRPPRVREPTPAAPSPPPQRPDPGNVLDIKI